MSKIDVLERYENKSIDNNNHLEFSLVDIINKEVGFELGITLREILLNPESIKYMELITKVLYMYDFNINDFYGDVFIDIATLPDKDLETLTKGYFITKIVKDGKNIIMYTKDGIIKARMLAQSIDDRYLLNKYGDHDLVGRCHELTGYMTKKYNLIANTAFMKMNLGGEYIHSYNTDGAGHVLDASHNLIMDEDEYNALYLPRIINQVSKDEYISSNEYIQLPRTGILPVYALALKRARTTRFAN